MWRQLGSRPSRYEDPTPHIQVVICTPGLLRPPKEKTTTSKIGLKDQCPRTKQWAEVVVSGLLKNQGKSVGASIGLCRIFLPGMYLHCELCWDIIWKQSPCMCS